MTESVLQQLGTIGVIPVVAIDDAAHAPELAGALIEGSLPCAEITFRTAAAEDAIRKIAEQFPQMLVGAGTVLTVGQAERAVEAGARFIVSPGFGPSVADWCLANKVPITPGVATATEIQMALEKGISILKFFPSENLGGVPSIKALAAPFVGVSFIPTGGINAQNLAEYLRVPAVVACGGSWMVTKQLIAERKFGEIARLAQEATAIVKATRQA